MSSVAKITASHLGRHAVVYVRQSTAAQVHDHRESTDRQYQLTHRASDLGWGPAQIDVIDQDLGISGGAATQREGFSQLISMVALGHVGIVLGPEASRLARMGLPTPLIDKPKVSGVGVRRKQWQKA